MMSAFLAFSVIFPVFGQEPTPAAQQAVTLQKSLTVLVGSNTLSDVTLTGTVRRLAGSDDQSGTATLKAVSPGVSRTDLALSSGTFTEVRNPTGNTPQGTWSGADGKDNAIAYHNLISEPAWSTPAILLAARLGDPSAILTDIGPETRNSLSVEHFSVALSQSNFSDLALFQHLTQFEIYIDFSTSLPSSVVFNLHPDNNELADIPVEILYSDYRSVNGFQIPFHIQKLLNNTLALDLQFQTVVTNTGLTIAQVGGAQ